MAEKTKTVLSVGATGSIGRLVVKDLLEAGYKVRALVRNAKKADLPEDAELFEGQLTDPATLKGLTEGVDGVVFTQGGSMLRIRAVDYGGTVNVLRAFGKRRPWVVLMTAVSVTARDGAYNRLTHSADWKRRAERLVRASGLPYTIVRPGWFDCNKPDEQKIIWRHGDKFVSGTPKDGAISREEIAKTLTASLFNPLAQGKTFEIVAEKGPATTDFDALFKDIPSDVKGAEDAPEDNPNQPLSQEPADVLEDLKAIAKQFSD